MNICKHRRAIALFLALALCLGMLPTAFAAQGVNYYDPAERWITSNNRTNELDANAILSRETFHCCVCNMNTIFTVYRTPEYSRDGATALTRNVLYSDGTMVDGEGGGRILDGTPGVDAHYTGYHWTKAVCETCGTINSNVGLSAYSYNKNIYALNDCAAEFFQNIPETVSYEYTDTRYHTKTIKGGDYCIFCFGTHSATVSKLERHDFTSTIQTQLANQRFVEVETCADCGYSHTEYLAAKAVISNYYGMVDGKPHTLTVADLSDAGVSTAIRYGTAADTCNLTSAPNYTEAGEYTVYYEITYTYGGQSMTENGVAYVQLRPQEPTEPPADLFGCTDHKYSLVSTVPATCTSLGYNRYLCTVCGATENRDYTAALGHSWDLGTVITPATCTTDGVKEHRCTRCSATTLEAIPANGHDYDEIVTPATCQTEGTITRRCKNCGESKTIGYMAALGHAWDGGTAVTVSNCTGDGVTEYRCTRCDAHYLAADSAAGHTPGPAATCTQAQVCTVCGVVLAGPIGHTYEKTVIPPTCLEGGKTVIACTDCGSAYEIDPTQSLGHDWDAGTPITTATCTGEGVMEHKCTRCNATYLEAQSAAGHTPGPAATCTQPQVCAACGAVLKKPLGHSYKATVTAPTCEKMGFTTYTCAACGDSYKSDYTNPTGHKAGDWIVDKAATTYAQGQKHKECTVCKKVLETAVIEKLYMTATTDTHGEAVVDGYLVTVTDTDTRQPVSGAEVVLDKKDGLTVLLPSRRLLDYNDQTTVTVRLVKDGSAVSALAVAVTDKNDNYAADTTDRAGKVTVPQGSTITSGDGKATVGWTDADRDRHTLTVKVTDFETTRPIVGADVSIGKTGSITVTLPRKVDMDEDNRITVTVTDHKQTPQEGLTVIVKADLGQREEGLTDKGGVLTVPPLPVDAQEHGAYIVGYDNGDFGAEDNMTRGEAAAIFARLLAQRKGERIYPTTYVAYTDIPAGAWYGPYARYLTSYGVTYGRGNGTFAGDELISRAEFVTMAVRFFSVYGDGAPDLMEQYKSFDDVAEGYWAARYIQTAAARGWIKGYSDGLFHSGANITRAEAVTVVNRLLGRESDKDYIKANLRKLVTFPDVPTRHWAYYDILEAANGHMARPAEVGESWNKK